MQVMVESSSMQESGQKERRKRDKLASRACVLCNQAHTACDDGRPCKRCVTKGIPHLCQDIEPRKRGRPAKSADQYDRDVQQALRRNGTVSSSSPSSALQLFQPYPSYETVASPLLLDIESSLFNDLPSPSGLDAHLFDAPPTPPLPSPHLYQAPVSYGYVPKPPPQQAACSSMSMEVSQPSPSAAPSSSASTITPPGFGAISTHGNCNSKFTEAHLNHVFLHLANKAGFSEITSELRTTMHKIIQFYAPLVAQYGANLLDMCPVRLMSVTQMFAEMSLPVVVAGCFFLLTANSAALELTGIKKSEIGPMSPSKKFIFDILHRDDAIPFVMKSVDCMVSFTDLDRMKVRLHLPSGICHCVISETIHRNNHGVPLFSSYTFVRIDDL